MKPIIYSLWLLSLAFFLNQSAHAQATIDIETGAVFTGYNDVRVPGDQGSLFSLKDDLSPQTAVFYRLRAGYTINSRHTLSLLYAPLETSSKGRAAREILFEGAVFDPDTPLEGRFRFNSYRLTYRYDLVHQPHLVFGLGLTAKMRDASIRLTSPGLTAVKDNVGFVPLINFRLWWKVDEKLGLLLEGDALAAPQGRAEDVQIAVTYKLSEPLVIRAGYRILEGGADNDEVYSFSLFNYASVGLTYTFLK